MLQRLAEEYAKPERGVTIREVAGGYRMGTKPEHHDAIRTFVKRMKPPLKLSLTALETLAVIAYKQPITTPEIMEMDSGRKALVLISSGVDTFSKAKYEDVLNAVRDCQTPVYVINMGPVLRIAEQLSAQPHAVVDWSRAEAELQQIAQASGGRLYSPGSTLNLSGVYDDMMENLRLRYVITYKSTTDVVNLNAARTVRVELVNPNTKRPLEIVDANGKPVRSKLFVQDNYVPRAVSLAQRPEREEK